MKKKSILICSFVLGITFICLLIRFAIPQAGNPDEWIGGYEYLELYPREDGVNYYTDYRITIWKQNNEYYAILQGDGWFLETWTLGYVSGDDKKITITFLQTLPGDRLYGFCERYEKGEVLVQFEREGQKIITEWKALRDQHPIFIESEDAIMGSYFEKVK